MKKYIGVVIGIALSVLSFGLLKVYAVEKAEMTVLDISKSSITIEKDKIVGYDKEGNLITEANSEGYYIMSSRNSVTNNNIVVKENVTTKVVLDNVNITINQDRKSAFLIEPSAKVDLILKNSNSLTGGKYNSAIQVPNGSKGTPAELLISGTGSMKAYAAHRAAAIGGSQDSYGATAGKITIKSGTIIAETGGNPGGYGAAIGGAEEGGGGTIIIDGGNITAISNRQANAIGGGRYRSTEGTIIINGGTVQAKCNYSGYYGLGAGNIQINGGNVSSTSPTNGYASTSKAPVNASGEKIYFVGIDFPSYNRNKVATLKTATEEIEVQLDNAGKSRFYIPATTLSGDIKISNGNKYVISETIVNQNIESIFTASLPNGVSLLNVEPEEKVSIYGDDLDLTYTVKDQTSATVDDVQFIGELEISGIQAGEYEISGDNLVIDSETYNFSFVDNKKYTIAKRRLIISMEPITLSYGESIYLNPNFNDFAYDDSKEDLSGELTYVLDKSFVKPNTYTMTLSGYHSSDYDIEYKDVSLTIVPATDGNYNYGEILEIGKNSQGETLRWMVVKVTNNQTYLINENMIGMSTWGTTVAEDIQLALDTIVFSEYETNLVASLAPIAKDSLPDYFENPDEYVFYDANKQALSWWLADSIFDQGTSQNQGVYVDESGDIKPGVNTDMLGVRGLLILNKTRGISEVKIQPLQNLFYDKIEADKDVAQIHVFGEYDASETFLLNENNEVNEWFSIDDTGLIRTKEELGVGNYIIKILIKDNWGKMVTDTCQIEVKNKIEEDADDNKPGDQGPESDKPDDDNSSGNQEPDNDDNLEDDKNLEQNDQTINKPNEKENSKEDIVKVETGDSTNFYLMLSYCILAFGVICFLKTTKK